jgi:fibronectin type 3 domain-containing protein
MLKFAPTGVGTDSGIITLEGSSTKELTLSMIGTGTKDTRTISASPTSLTFGNEAVGNTEKLAVTLKNTGNLNVTISQVSLTGIDANVTSGLNGQTIAPGQIATFVVNFAPKRAELMSGSVKISSNAANSPTVITLSGTGVSPGVSRGVSPPSLPSATAHSVALSWDASTSSGVVGYKVYRAISPSTAYAILFSSPISGLNYTDETVAAGQTYTYVVTAVNSAGEESVHSGSVTAVIP